MIEIHCHNLVHSSPIAQKTQFHTIMSDLEDLDGELAPLVQSEVPERVSVAGDDTPWGAETGCSLPARKRWNGAGAIGCGGSKKYYLIKHIEQSILLFLKLFSTAAGDFIKGVRD